ncbi:MAG: exodeoxyribonuclease VII large subunit [Verrucomicrobiales bacterium]
MAEPVQVLSITQLTRKIRMMLEIQVGEVWVEGEVSNARSQKSGHVYFTLKDETAQLACVLFRGAATKNRLEIRDGMNVQAFGEITVYEAQGKYQLIVSRLQEKGVGALQARFEALKKRLQEEGLFDTDRKRPIARFPRAIGIVTSPTGAAVRDLLNVLGRRAPWVHVIVAPVRVQGKGAEDEIAAAIELLNRESGKSLPELDTLIVGRGGGSIEDLWCFNEEVVARAIVASRIPIISAVGHEIDFTISDFAADLRAPTPSAAAELSVPDGDDLRRRLTSLGGKMDALVTRKLEYLSRLLAGRSRESLRRGPEFILREAGQNLDRASENLQFAVSSRFDGMATRLDNARRVLAAAKPEIALDRAGERVTLASSRLESAMARRIERNGERLASLRSLLVSLGPDSVLKRGFTLTLGPDGKPVRRVADVRAGDVLRTRLAEGEVTSTVNG